MAASLLNKILGFNWAVDQLCLARTVIHGRVLFMTARVFRAKENERTKLNCLSIQREGKL